MASTTEIAWCDSTFNPWIGCTRISTAESGGGGCDHCYAAESTPVRVLRGKGQETWGPGVPRQRTSSGYWDGPRRWNAQPFVECRFCGWRGEQRAATFGGATCPECSPVSGTLVPARRRVFCASLADVFDNEVDPVWRADLFALIDATPNLDWLLLTKRIGNASRMITEVDNLRGRAWAPHIPNVWIGATIVNQHEANRDVPKLLATPAAVRFLSIEPMLGPVDLEHVHAIPNNAPVNALSPKGCVQHAPGHCMGGCPWRWRRLDWVITGGESGPNARPAHPDWFRALRDQCAAAGIAFNFKQWGEFGPHDRGRVDSRSLATPKSLDEPMCRYGKKTAGRMLDGRKHNGFPEVHHG